MTESLRHLVQVGIDLAGERDLEVLTQRALAEACQFTGAEAGALLLRKDDELCLAARLGIGEPDAEPWKLCETTPAGYAALYDAVVNVADARTIPESLPYRGRFAAVPGEQAVVSGLVVPLREPSGNVVGVLELVNARDAQGQVVPFADEQGQIVQALACQAAVAIRNALLADLSVKDALTDIYNRRYFMIRLEEEARRHARLGEPVSLVIIDVDHFKQVNDGFGHRAGDDALREVAGLLVRYSRDFSVVTRFGGDEFAVLLASTPRAGAVRYAERIRAVVEQHAFPHGQVTVSLGVASLPDDAATGDALLAAADRAMYEAKRQGRNQVAVLP